MKTLLQYYSPALIIILFIIAAITLFPIILNAQNPDWVVYSPENTPLLDTDIESMAVDMSGNIWVGTHLGGLAKFNGINWTLYDKSDYGANSNWVSSILLEGQQNIWVGTSPCGNIDGCLSMFNGSTWTVYRNSLTRHITSLAIDSQGNKWFGTCNSGLVCFDGENWTVYNTDNSNIPQNGVATVAIDKQDNKWIGYGFQGYGVARLSGTNWLIYNTTNSDLPHNDIAKIYVDRFNSKWIGTYGGGLARFNSGNWTVYNTFNSDLPSNFVWTMTMDKTDTLWVGTGNYGGIAKFYGGFWTIINTSNSGLPSDVISELEFDDNGNLWIGTYYGGVAAYRNGGVIITGMENTCHTKIPSGFLLSQNFPNPFNCMTTIVYELPIHQHVTCNLYDIQGHKVETLVNESQNAGIYSFRYNAAHLPSGTYFYRLNTEQFSEVKKLVIVK